jgi:cyclopropane fatty-acyl-phospholipid synthase-like methyltransferase
MKPYAESCDENREPILAVIQPLLHKAGSVLEIGSGTGQHAVYFAEKLPHLVWHTSDRIEYHAGIKMWLQETNLVNTRGPLELDVSQSEWPRQSFDAVFSANTIHIMHWPDVEALFSGAGSVLSTAGCLLLYGPFNYGNRYTSESNARFDQWLKGRDPASGIRNFEDLDRLANQAGMMLKDDVEMPVNNRILYWEKQ